MSRSALIVILGAALFLPMLACLFAGAAWLFAAMGDESLAVLLRWTASSVGLIWLLDLVALLFVQSWPLIAQLVPPPQPTE